jgi:hypothetical protein
VPVIIDQIDVDVAPPPAEPATPAREADSRPQALQRQVLALLHEQAMRAARLLAD